MAGMLMPWSLGDALLMFAMWLVMMIGMMLPSAAPIRARARRVTRSSSP